MFNVEKKIIAITGGAGKLGQKFSESLLSKGANVVSLDVLRSSKLQSQNYLPIQADITCSKEVKQALKDIVDKWNAVPYGLINCAALDSPPDAPAEENGPFESYPETSWDRVMTVNTRGVFIPSQVFGGAMAKAGRGSIINISSIYGMVSPDQRVYAYRNQNDEVFCKPVAYSASKSAILNLTRYLATYWAKKGVRVNTLTFGGVFAEQDEAFLKNYCARVPLGRMANPDEYNGAIVFLLSNASSYMTGANLVIDGGWTAW